MVACGGREGGREGGRQAGRERGRKREGGKGGDGKKVEKRPLKSLVATTTLTQTYLYKGQ